VELGLSQRGRNLYRLRVFKNRVLRKVFRPERDEVMGECRGHYNEKLYDVHSSPSIIQAIKS